MKRFIIVLVLFALIGITYSTANAEDQSKPLVVNVDLSKLPDTLRNQVIAQMNPTQSDNSNVIEKVLADTENVTKYMNSFALGLKEVCKVLSIEVNEFVKTPVGMITTAIVLYKVLDVDSGAIITYFKELIFVTPCGLFVLFFMWRWNRRLLYGWSEILPTYDNNGKKTKEKKYVTHDPKYDDYDSDDKGFVWLGTVLMALVGIVLVMVGII